MDERFGRYAEDPVKFARSVLGAEQIPPYQADVLGDIAAHDRVAWVAGHATGKSHAAAMLLAWYLVTRPHCRCVVTSATFDRQVGRVIFAKLRTMVAKARVPLPIRVQATRAIQTARLATNSAEASLGTPVPWVFHDQGQPFRADSRSGFYAVWNAACVKTGVLGQDGRPKRLHDCRRSAVRRYDRTGVSREVAKRLVGHKTDSMYQRYNIVAEDELATGLAQSYQGVKPPLSHPTPPAAHTSDVS
jgi:integrase